MTATVVCTVREASVVDKSRKVLSVCWWLQVLFSSCCACRTDLTQVLHSTIIQLHVLNSTVQALPSICAPDVINCITRAGLLSKVSLCYCAVACSESLAISSKSGCESTAGCKRPRAHCCFFTCCWAGETRTAWSSDNHQLLRPPTSAVCHRCDIRETGWSAK